MKCVLIGCGEIGQAVREVFKDYHEIEVHDPNLGMYATEGRYDILLVAIPYSENFVQIVNEYRGKFDPIKTIIFSTVAIGTTSQIPDAVHSPVEGKHPRLVDSMKIMPRWVGGINFTVFHFFRQADFEPIYVPKPEFTEALKLRSTARYGINIEFARYEKELCDAVGMDYKLIQRFDRHYNQLYKELGMPEYQRYILYPPEGNIKGHCVRENSIILDRQYPSIFLKEIYRNKEGV